MTEATIKLVQNEEPIWVTVQGEGSRVGELSTFVRMFGCSYDCSFCDTPGSWQPGYGFTERKVVDVAGEIKAKGVHSVVITGGNPLEQPQALLDLLQELKKSRYSAPHVTIETQGVGWSDGIAYADLVSISPKRLGTQAGEDMFHLFLRRLSQLSIFMPELQFKFVVQSMQEVDDILWKIIPNILKEVTGTDNVLGLKLAEPTYILQPEHSLYKTLLPLLLKRTTNQKEEPFPHNVRVVPQMHKLVYKLK